jgi:glycosyltransferase involved in cell wall biosynthesis
MGISIVIPTYNGSSFLEQALKSALAQTYRNKEIILVDDASTDDTVEIAETFHRFRFHNSSFRIVRNPNRLGMVANWNRCLELASGEWIKFLHQDDELAPECVEAMVAAVKQHPEERIIACRRTLAFDESVAIKQRQYWNEFIERSSVAAHFTSSHWIASGEKYFNCRAIWPEQFSEYMARVPTINAIGEPSCVMIHRSAVEALGGFNPALIQLVDWEYFARIAVWKGLVYIDTPLATYRIHRGSETQFNAAKRNFQFQFMDPKIIFGAIAHSKFYEEVRKAAEELKIDYNERFERMGRVHQLR